MENNKPTAQLVEGQSDDLDRGTRKARDDAKNERDDALDDEYARPPDDRSPLT